MKKVLSLMAAFTMTAGVCLQSFAMETEPTDTNIETVSVTEDVTTEQNEESELHDSSNLKNLASEYNWNDGYYLNINNGCFGKASNYSITAKAVNTVKNNIPLIGSDKSYIVNHTGSLLYGFYDDNYTFVSGYEIKAVDDTTVLTENISAPINAKYIVFSCKTINKGNLEVFEEVEEETTSPMEQMPIDLLNNTSDNTDEINDSFELENEEIIPVEWTDNRVVRTDTGNISYVEGYAVSLKSTIRLRGNATPIDPDATYTIVHVGKLQYCFYAEDYSFVSGVHRTAKNDTDVIKETFVVPENARYIVCSCKMINKDKFQLIKGELKNNTTNIIEQSSIKTNVLEVGEGKEFSTLKEAFQHCSDSSDNNRYEVRFYGNGTEYDISNELDDSNNKYGLFVPPYTKLVGVGGKEKNILALRLSEKNQELSTLNLYSSSELEGLTVIGSKTRYAIHDDWYIDLDPVDRTIKDCHFISDNCRYYRAYGSGFRGGCKWNFTNCIFEGRNGDYAFSSHNNTNFIDKGEITFDNCRFISSMNNQAVVFSSLGTANDPVNDIVFKGCLIDKLLFEPTAGYSVMKFNVSGYANDIKTGNENIIITNYDGIDYSDRIDLI